MASKKKTTAKKAAPKAEKIAKPVSLSPAPEGGRVRHSHEAFVRAIMECGTVGATAEALGMQPRSVQARAYHLRKLGIKLPYFIRTAAPVDVDALNQLVDAYTPDPEEE